MSGFPNTVNKKCHSSWQCRCEKFQTLSRTNFIKSILIFKDLFTYVPNKIYLNNDHSSRYSAKLYNTVGQMQFEETQHTYTLWQYGLLSFQGRDTKLERFGAKPQNMWKIFPLVPSKKPLTEITDITKCLLFNFWVIRLTKW